MKTLLIFLAALAMFTISMPCPGQHFEGRVQMALSTPENSGTMTYIIKKDKIAIDIKFTYKGKKTRMKFIPDLDAGILYWLTDNGHEKTYVALPIDREARTSQAKVIHAGSPGKGKETFKHTDPRTQAQTEITLKKDERADLSLYAQVFPEDPFMQTLLATGQKGLPQLIKEYDKEGKLKRTIELVGVSEENIPDEAFAIPEGYTLTPLRPRQ